MRVWDETVQQMLDWLEDHIPEASLLALSRAVGYSPCYCSQQFHRVTGCTLRRYIAGRRLAIATLALRDTDARILDIALDAGYGSQEALTRAFAAAYGITPYAYRRQPGPIPLPMRRQALFPDEISQGGDKTMQNAMLTDARVRALYIPAHRYIGIWDARVDNYMDFWNYHDCDEVCGTVESMAHVADPVVTPHTAGWVQAEGGKVAYFYGLGVPADYDGPIPEGFEMRDIPASYYLVFFHPPFDYQRDCDAVMRRVEAMAKAFDPAQMRFAWRQQAPVYQRHLPETVGYEVVRPVSRA